MARVIVVYESKYGNTKLVAETIVEGMKEVGGVETTLVKVKSEHLAICPVLSYPFPELLCPPYDGVASLFPYLGGTTMAFMSRSHEFAEIVGDYQSTKQESQKA